MARIRIHELAKKLGKENKEILNYLTEKGIQVKSPMNSLEEEQVAMVEDKFGKKETKPEGKAEAADEDTFDYEEAYEETSDKETEDMLNEEGDQE